MMSICDFKFFELMITFARLVTNCHLLVLILTMLCEKCCYIEMKSYVHAIR